ncbi:MAG TPA: CoA ester lyase [Gammaproteobacteria bacterium]|nr:CoA ester lyase [Gammaproteobacteria bacterium]
MMVRSWLFVPGDSEKKLGKGESTGADALILDLEDSVAAARRPVGREMTREYLEGADRSVCQLYVRINPLDSKDALQDLAGIIGGKPDGLVLPKAETVEDSHRLACYLDALEIANGIEQGTTKTFPIATETPGAMLTLDGYRDANERLSALAWGAEDLSAAIGASTNRDENGDMAAPYVLARSLCLMAAYAAGVQAVDTVYTDFRDDEGLRTSSNYARRDGFTGKIAIHPNQVGIINDAFTPSAEETAHAEAVIALFAANPEAGTLSLDGKMLDKPHLTQAERVLALARQAGG